MTDLRFATRALLRNPTATCVIVLTLAVAIGVSTIIASTVDSVWHALPVADTERLIFVSSTDPRPGEARAGMAGDIAITGTSIPDLVDWMAQSTTVDDFAVAIVDHSMHHARFDGHYGFVTAMMDRTFGTEWPDWLELHTKVMDGHPLRSLREKGRSAGARSAT